MRLESRHFITDISFDSDVELLSFAAELLSKEGYVTDAYKESLLKREKAFPTGIETDYLNFAIPHAELENVNDNTFLVILPRKPVPFCNMLNAEAVLEVEIVILLVLKGKKEHLEFLSKVSYLFQHADEIKKVLAFTKDQQFAFFKNALETE